MHNKHIKTLIISFTVAALLSSCRTQKQAAQTQFQNSRLENSVQDTTQTTRQEQRHTRLTITYIPLTQPQSKEEPMPNTQETPAVHQPSPVQTAEILAQVLADNGGGTIIIQEEQTNINQEQTQTHTYSNTDQEQNTYSTMTLRDYRRTPTAISIYFIFGLFALGIILEIIKLYIKP